MQSSKYIRRSLTFLISILLLITSCVGVYAADVTVSNATFMTKLENGVEEVLFSIESNKEMYGMNGIDFSTLKLGNEIPAYNLTANGLTETTVRYFPIISNNEWVATCAAFYDVNQEVIVQVSQDYVNVFENGDVEYGDDIALVFDDRGAHVFTDDERIEAAASTTADESKASLETYTGRVAPAKSKLRNSVQLDIERVEVAERTTMRSVSSTPVAYTINVPFVKQSVDGQCWAACIASVKTYKERLSNPTATKTTIDNVYDFGNVTKYNGADFATLIKVLRNYGLFVDEETLSLSWSDLKNHIGLAQRPIIAYCTTMAVGQMGRGHDVVIGGYTEYTNSSNLGTIHYMDPLATPVNNNVEVLFRASTVPSDGNYFYVSSSGDTYAFTCFAITKGYYD